MTPDRAEPEPRIGRPWRSLPPGLRALLLAAALASALFAVWGGLRVQADALQVERLRFEAAAAAHAAGLRQHLAAREALARAVAAAFHPPPGGLGPAALDAVDPRFLGLVPEIVSFVWVPRVEAGGAPAVLAALASAGVPRQALLGPAGAPLPPGAEAGRTLFPVLDIQPRSPTNLRSLGLDLGTLPLPRAALAAAEARGDAAATAPLELVQLPGIRAFVLYVPIAAPGRGAGAPPTGYLGFSYRYDRLIEAALPGGAALPAAAVSFTLADAGAPEAGVLAAGGPAGPAGPPAVTTELAFGGRVWVARYWPTTDIAAEARRRGLAAGLLAGLVCGLLLAVALHLGRLSDGLARALAARREAAAALARANAELEERVARRTRALADSEARFRAWFEAADDAVFVVRLETGGRFLHEAWNPAAERLSGVAAAVILGRSLAEVAPGAAPVVEAQYRATVAAGAPRRFEQRVAFPGGERLCEVSMVPLRDTATGALTRLVGIARDATERRALEAEVAQARKMDAVGQLTGGVAHDFNNLLMAVLGSLGLLRKRLPEGDERARRLLENAVQGAERGAALTRRMLAFARRQELRAEAVDLHALAGGMVEMLRRTLGPAVEVQVAVPPDLPPARADANQLELALLNLGVNARDAMPAGGVLRIAAEAVTAEGTADGAAEGAAGGAAGGAAAARPAGLPAGRYLRLTVADTGTGMDPATLARATEPFFTTKGAGKGTGLGLAMVHGFAGQSGGALVLRSTPGRGTAAELWLPQASADPAAPPARPADPAAAAPSRRLRVLLVDDDPLVLTGTAAMLEDLGHLVVAAVPSGEAALAVLRGAGPLDLLLTDYAMPGMTGAQLADAARALRPDLPVLLATGYAELDTNRAPAGLPRLGKPYAQEELARALDAVVLGAAPDDDPKVVPLARPRGRG